jgi:hypothetical protein
MRTARLSVVPAHPSDRTADTPEVLAQRRARRIALGLMALSALTTIAIIAVAWILLRHF